MDELSLLRSTRDTTSGPSASALAAGRAALVDRAADVERLRAVSTAPVPIVTTSPTPRHSFRRGLTWSAVGLTAAMTAVLVVGNLSLSAQSAHAAEVLRGAATQATGLDDLVPGPGQYLRSSMHANWMGCGSADGSPDGITCAMDEQFIDVYMPADADDEWVMVRDWGDMQGVTTNASVETIRVRDARFYGPGSQWAQAVADDIPTDGAAAYAWSDAQYIGGSASRAEDNFQRIAALLRTGLVPAAQRAALLDALAVIPGVTATEGVANLDGVEGVAIGRAEPLRAGQRQEIIIDPGTGLVIGDRTVNGLAVFGFGPHEVVEHTAIETTVVDAAP